MAEMGHCTDCGAQHEVEGDEDCMCGGTIRTVDEGQVRKVEVSWHGPVASAIADAVGEALKEQGPCSLIQMVTGSRHDGLEALHTVKNRDAVLEAAHDALCEHHPDEMPDDAETSVRSLDIEVESHGIVVLDVWGQDEGGDS
ncbi:hypothetical protein [Haloarcula pellucida]|uniref:Uncharacterized protein n=1 Tax=Haloarcula pellucida TaxID=1427151 RepID=A0A830GUU6_9EURY|nr:hypothetical protein [Halomicroarcula pellucida]MBX0350472.1 hypothetical protein [Halomicroarcula pellucida]GGO03490.1 hypothetical protein GCM10009030_39180 [Halomicroarcula pellucida]